MKRLLLALVVVGMVAVAAYAIDPPPEGGWNGQWGQDCTDWVWFDPQSGWGPYEAVYDPVANVFKVCGSTTLEWPTLTVDMYIEWEILVYFQYTHVQVHLASFYDPVTVEMTGNYIKSNGPSRFQIIAQPGYTTNYLKWLTPVVPGYSGTNCPITAWEISINGGPWVSMNGLPGETRWWDFSSCDQYFAYRFVIDPEYHQAAGHYDLQVILCPIPPA